MSKMNIYPEIKKIAGKNDAIRRLTTKLEDKLDCEGLGWECAKLIDGCSVRNGHLYQNGKRLDNGGLVDNDYFCDQHTSGYCEDDYYGTVWFPTNVPGQFVEVPFAM